MPTWGGIIKDHYSYIVLGKPYLAVIPGLAIMSLVTAFMLVGNALRDALDVEKLIFFTKSNNLKRQALQK